MKNPSEEMRDGCLMKRKTALSASRITGQNAKGTTREKRCKEQEQLGGGVGCRRKCESRSRQAGNMLALKGPGEEYECPMMLQSPGIQERSGNTKISAVYL